MSQDLREVIIAKQLGARTKPDGSIDEVKVQTEHMSALDKAMDTAKRLAGVDGFAETVKEKDKKMEQIQEAHDKTKDELQKTQLKLIEEQLGTKIDKLSESIKGGASPKSIGEQIAEVKKAASELGFGGSKVSEFKEMLEFIKNLNPQKNLADQLNEAKELIAAFQPAKSPESFIEGMPASIVLQIKQIDANLKIELERMADERQKRDQDFKLVLLKFEEDRNLRRQEVDGKILVERERNELISNALKTVGGAIGQGMKDGAAASPGTISKNPQTTDKVFQFQVPEGGFGTTECPNCKAPIEIGPTTNLAECLECKTQYPVVRTAAKSPGAPQKEED